MAGLYDGLEEVPFKRISGGYLFQTNNPWFFGPKQRHLVNEAQKAQIAACIRDNLRRIKPFVFVAMVLIPAMLIGSIFWFATRGGTLNVTIAESDGRTTSYSQPIGPDGSSGTLPGADGSSINFHISGLPGGSSKVTVKGVAATGKTGTPIIVRFDAGGATINITDGKNHIVRTARLVGRVGPTTTAVMLFSLLVAIGLFGVYVGVIHAYSMSRLRPLLLNLPPSDDRITFAENIRRFGVNISNKLLALMAFGAAMALLGNAINLADVFLSHRSIDNPFLLITAGVSILLIGQVVGLAILKARAPRSVSEPPATKA
jgi:hypothetical protein